MRQSLMDLWPYDEATLFDLVLYDYDKAATRFDEPPDAALEVAAGKPGEIGNPFTIAFCSGLDTCPA
jgi:hypothetical protein